MCTPQSANLHLSSLHPLGFRFASVRVQKCFYDCKLNTWDSNVHPYQVCSPNVQPRCKMYPLFSKCVWRSMYPYFVQQWYSSPTRYFEIDYKYSKYSVQVYNKFISIHNIQYKVLISLSTDFFLFRRWFKRLSTTPWQIEPPSSSPTGSPPSGMPTS